MIKRLWKHFVSILGNAVLNIVGNVVLVPIFLAHWNPAIYGEWLVVSSVTNYLSTLDFGMNSAVGNRLLTSFTVKDLQNYKRCQHSAMAFYLSLAVFGTLIIGLLVSFVPIAHTIGLKATDSKDAALIIWLLSLQVLWAMPAGLIGNTYRTIGEPSRTQWLNNFRAISSMIVVVVVLLAHGNMKQMAIAQLLPLVLWTLLVLWHLNRRFPFFLPGLSQANFQIVREIIKPSAFFGIIMIAMAITLQGTVLVVSTLLGSVVVAAFVTTRTLTNVAMQMVGMIKNAAWPDLTMLFAEGKQERLKKVVRLLLTTSITVCIGVASALFFEGREVMAVWTHHQLHVDPLFLSLFLLYLVLQSPWMACSGLLIAVNRHQGLARSYMISSVLGIIIAIVLIPHFGLAAVPISLIVSEAVACYHFVIKDTCAIIDEPYLPFATRVWSGLILVLLPTLGVGWAVHQISWGPAILRWLEVGSGTTVVAFLTAWWVCLVPYERHFLQGSFQKVIANASPSRVSKVSA